MKTDKIKGRTVPRVFSVTKDKEEDASSMEQTRHDLQEAVKDSNEVLRTATTKMTFFPDTLVLDRTKLTVTKRTFVSSSEVVSIRIEDILNVMASVGPILGTIEITSRVPNAPPYHLGKFWRQDALTIKRITQGYAIALKQDIDCNALPAHELVAMLDKLGEDDHANQN